MHLEDDKTGFDITYQANEILKHSLVGQVTLLSMSTWWLLLHYHFILDMDSDLLRNNIIGVNVPYLIWSLYHTYTFMWVIYVCLAERHLDCSLCVCACEISHPLMFNENSVLSYWHLNEVHLCPVKGDKQIASLLRKLLNAPLVQKWMRDLLLWVWLYLSASAASPHTHTRTHTRNGLNGFRVNDVLANC